MRVFSFNVVFAICANVAMETPANLGLDAFFPCEGTPLQQKLLYLKEGLRSISFGKFALE
jgi:hypothetical protein